MQSGAHSDAARLARLALVAGALPLVIVHLCYVISVQGGILPACIPYISGCTSISAAGRHGPAWVIFKAGMIPSALVIACYWRQCRRWLLGLGRPESDTLRAMVALGVLSAVFLALYTVFLGSKGDIYNLMRRYGVTVHLSFGVLAQILLTRELLNLGTDPTRVLPSRHIVRGKLLLVGVLLALGLASIPIGNFMPDKSRAMNAIEWSFGALMATFYLLTWRAARATASPASPTPAEYRR